MQRAALRRLAAWRARRRHGGYPAARALLRRDGPRIAGSPPGSPLLAGGYTVEQAVDLALRLDAAMLRSRAPGDGQDLRGCADRRRADGAGRRVGVTAPSHKAIHNLLEEIERIARAAGVAFRGLQASGDSDNAYDSPLGDGGSIENVANDAIEAASGDVLLVAGTAWLFAREGMADAIDTLIVDEAGQVVPG